MPEALISLPDSNLAVDNRFTGSRIKKAGDSSGSTESKKNEETKSFSEIKRSLNKKTETDRPEEQDRKNEVKPEENSGDASEAMSGIVVPYVHPETEGVPSLETALSEGTVDTGAIAQANVSNADISNAFAVENTIQTAQSGENAAEVQTPGASDGNSLYGEMDNLSIAARSFSDSVSTAKNNPAKAIAADAQETTADLSGENKADPLDKLFQKNTGDPSSIRDAAKTRGAVTEKTLKNGTGQNGDNFQTGTSEQTSSAKLNTLRNDFTPFKGDLPEDIMEKNILGNFKLREFFNSINGKTSIQAKSLNSIKESLESMGDNLSNLKINATFQEGDSSGRFMLNINTNKEMLKIKTQAEGGIAGLEGFKNQVESRFGENLKKVTPSSQLNENSMTDVTSTARNSQATSAEMKDNDAIPTVSKERFTDFFVSKVREYFPDSIDGKKILKVIITPPDLGEVKVTMEMKKSVLHASFQCTPEAAKAINSQVQNLSRSLSNVGIQLGSSNIDTGQHNPNTQQNNHSQGYNHASQQEADVFPLQASVDEGIFTENSKVLNVLI